MAYANFSCLRFPQRYLKCFFFTQYSNVFNIILCPTRAPIIRNQEPHAFATYS